MTSTTTWNSWLRAISARLPIAILAVGAVLFFATTNSARGAFVVGSFDVARGGFDSLDDPGQAAQKALILSLHPEVTFSSTSTLTSAYLSTVNTMVIGDGFDVSHTITALSLAEQLALFQFVSNGGNLAVFTENNNYDLVNGDTSRASLLSPFGLATTGWIVNDTANIVASPTHPIALGPGGPLTHFDLHNTGWLTSLGPYAHTIAIETATGMPVMAAIERGAISPTSGRAVFLTDSSVFDDGFIYGPVLAANLVGYLVPEPGIAPQAALAILGFATFMGVYRRKARREPRRS
jgi:hypothetical protein